MLILSRSVLRKIEAARTRLSILKFDELNVGREIDRFYLEINNACKREFEREYTERYVELWMYLKGEDPDEDELDELVGMYLAGLWDEPNENTHYAFQSELVRKRDRAKEAVVSVPTQTQKQLELQKAGRFLIQQIGFYADIVEDDASLQALKDAGVKKVRWNIYGDDKVCKSCRDLNGMIFPIEQVPEKPHLRCRCYLTVAQ